jgi:hypothetical protein
MRTNKLKPSSPVETLWKNQHSDHAEMVAELVQRAVVRVTTDETVSRKLSAGGEASKRELTKDTKFMTRSQPILLQVVLVQSHRQDAEDL